jgi:MFS family permease
VQTENSIGKSRLNGGNLRIQLLVIVVLGLSSFVSFYIVSPTLPLYVLGIGGTKLEIGLILSVSSIVIVFTRIPLGALSDRIGRWDFLIFSFIGHSVLSFLYLVVPNVGWLYPLRAIHAVTTAVFTPLLVSITSGLVGKEQRGRVLSIYLMTPAASMMIGPIVNSILVERGGYLLTFVAAGCLPFGGFLVLMLARKARLFQETSAQSRDSEWSSRKAGTTSVLKSLMLSKSVAAISIARASFSVTDGIFGTVFAIFVVQNLSMPPHMIGLFFAVKGLANTFVRWPIGVFADRVGGKGPVLIAFTVTGLAFAVLSEVQSIWLITLTMVMIGLAWGTRAVTEWVLVANLPGGSSTTGTAYMATMFDLGEAIGALLAGVLMVFLPLSWVFKIAASIVVLGVVPLAVTRV